MTTNDLITQIHNRIDILQPQLNGFNKFLRFFGFGNRKFKKDIYLLQKTKKLSDFWVGVEKNKEKRKLLINAVDDLLNFIKINRF